MVLVFVSINSCYFLLYHCRMKRVPCKVGNLLLNIVAFVCVLRSCEHGSPTETTSSVQDGEFFLTRGGTVG